MTVIITKLDHWIRLSRKNLTRNINQSGFFPYKKYTLLGGEESTVQTFHIYISLTDCKPEVTEKSISLRRCITGGKG